MTRPLRSYVLMRKSGVAADRRDFARSVTLALAASHDSDQVGPELRALTLRQVAITHALAGDGKASQPARPRGVLSTRSLAVSSRARRSPTPPSRT